MRRFVTGPRSWRPLVGAAAAATVAAALWAPSSGGALAAPAAAKTFDVTTSQCTGPGSLVAAVTAANNNPGRDTIRFRSGLAVQASGCPPVYGGAGYQPGHYFLAKVTESVTFEGNGAKLAGAIYWLNESGNFNPGYCPDSKTGVLRLATTPGFLEVGRRGADNSGIDVAVHNLSMDQVSSVARVRAGGSLELDGVTATKIYSNDKDCGEPAVLLDENSSGRILNSTFASVINNAEADTIMGTGIVAGYHARHLYVLNSQFVQSRGGYGLVWWGNDAGATANVVSSQFNDAEGILAYGGT